MDDAMDTRDRWRSRTLPALRGTVLDVGAGTGVAAGLLDASVTWIALEPARYARVELSARVAARNGSRYLTDRAESIPLDDGSVDAAIASTVLCSVRDQRATLAEVLRVLRPGGSLVFYEHVIGSRGSWTRFLQRAYAPLSRIIDDGCDPARDTESAIRAAGFASVQVRAFETPGILGTVEPHIEGVAVR
ncbi:class I SAM-dependent methyltransferase [Planctomonas sp. JC2975]|uniref:class I SAM-dependent methyltransferase n=1 Tax=Planctomonas sp. JC2975 TaxID=2729626 RepID=UPI0014760240|nr:class I SAM-dependent methyltransferase [Planctomonas sp. JC2975]NNC12453.1 class I SAM-dependent methyltransferase [Planctomonas sp. JC2975]